MLQISEIIELIENELNRIRLPQQPAGLYSPVSYMLSIGGKRIRPALSLMSSNLFSDQVQPFVSTALAMEVFHNFTLMHDDIMDNAPIRRGKQSVHEKWNLNTAILSGDVMLVKAYELLAEMQSAQFIEILRRFNQTAAKVCEGQQIDIDFEKLKEVSAVEYIEMITNKTAVLLGCSLFCGALAAGGSLTDGNILYETGIAAGISFQIMDDVLDVYGEHAAVGKTIGGDILQNKKTFLFVRTLELANEADRNELISIYSGSAANQNKIHSVMNLFDKYHVRNEAETTMKKYFDLAMNSLKQVGVPEDRKQILLQFFNTVYTRNF